MKNSGQDEDSRNQKHLSYLLALWLRQFVKLIVLTTPPLLNAHLGWHGNQRENAC